jgi:hypothetical protein
MSIMRICIQSKCRLVHAIEEKKEEEEEEERTIIIMVKKNELK